MARNAQWKNRLTTMLACGVFVFSTATALAAPVELSLDDSIAFALKNNPSIRMADADRESAVWGIDKARSERLPTLSLVHTDIRTKTAPGLVPSTIKDNFDNSATLALPLYTGGRVEGDINQAKISLKIADLGVDDTKQQVKLDATSGYFGILQTRNLVKVSQESVDSLAAHLKNVQAQYDVGTVAKSDVLRSEVELANAQQSLIKAQNAYDLAVSSLNNVMGLPLDTELTVKDDLRYEKYTMSLADSIQYALNKRPAVAQAEAGVDYAKGGVDIAKSGHLPTVSASAMSDWNDQDFPGANNNNWRVGLSVSWNAFDSGLTDSKIKQAYAATTKASEKSRQTKDAVQLDVRNAYLNMQEAEKRIGTSQVAVDKAQEDFKIAQVRYGAGVGTNLDVIDAQVALTQAKTNYIQAMYDYNTSKAKLEKAMGVDVK